MRRTWLTLSLLIGVVGSGAATRVAAADLPVPAAQIDTNGRSVFDLSQDGRFVLTTDSDGLEPFRRIDRSTNAVVEADIGSFGQPVNLSADGSKLLYKTFGQASIYDFGTQLSTPVPLPPVAPQESVTITDMSDDASTFGIRITSSNVIRNTAGIWMPATSRVVAFDTLVPLQPGSIANQSTEVALSRDGRYSAVVIYPFAGCTICQRLWVYDRVTNVITNESPFEQVTEGSLAFGAFGISGDGRHLIFESDSPNTLDSPVGSVKLRIYARHLDFGRTVVLSERPALWAAGFRRLRISDGGVAATLMEPRPTGPTASPLPQPVLIDVASGIPIELIDPAGSTPSLMGWGVDLSDDGSTVVFSAFGGNAPAVRPSDDPVVRTYVAGTRSGRPARLLDTRSQGRTVDGQFQGGGPRTAGSTLVLAVDGRAGVSADTEAVVLNVTALNMQGPGFVTIDSCNPTRPTVSSLNFVPGTPAGNMAIVSPDTSGDICVFTSQTTDLVVDVGNVLPAASPWEPMTPSRLLDRRLNGAGTIDGLFVGGGPLQANTELQLPVSGRAGIPAGAEAAVVNVTVVNPPANGYVQAYRCGSAANVVTVVNHASGTTRGGMGVVALDSAGSLCLKASQPVIVIVDAWGYFPADSSFVPQVIPGLVETRPPGIRLKALSSLPVPIHSIPQLSGARSVVLNITSAAAVANGFVTAYPCGTLRPAAATLNFGRNTASNNHTVVDVGDDGEVCFYVSQDTHLIVHLLGWFPEDPG